MRGVPPSPVSWSLDSPAPTLRWVRVRARLSTCVRVWRTTGGLELGDQDGVVAGEVYEGGVTQQQSQATLVALQLNSRVFFIPN